MVKAWAAVLTKLGLAYPPPGSRIGDMSSEEVVMMARVWADELSDVPVDAVEELHRRVMKARKAPYCPNVGDYRETWNAWDYWAEVNSYDEPNTYLALPQAMGAADAPEFVKQFQACGPVMCKCAETKSSNGKFVYPVMAQMMTVKELMDAGRDEKYTGLDYNNCTRPWEAGAPRYWVCAEGKCDFCVDANRLSEVLPPKRVRNGDGFSAVSEIIGSVGKPQRTTAEPEPTAPHITDDEVIAALTACGFPVEQKGEARSLAFGRYLVQQLGVAGLNERDAKTLWPEFKAQSAPAEQVAS